jgi:mono/diheme cytochrome c family protein
MTTLNTGCYYNKTPLPPAPEGDISYSTDIQSIFNDNCVACHQTGTGVPLDLQADNSYNNLYDGGYINLDDPSASVLYIKVSPGQSMNSYVTDNQLAVILLWIEQGGLNN